MAEETQEVVPPEDDAAKKEKDVVPKAQFLAALKSANEKYERLEAKVAELSNKPAPATPAPEARRYTRAELNGLVAAQHITQDQADAQIEYQLREDATAAARSVAAETVSAAQRTGFIETEIARYVALAPEIMDETHETRERIKAEYKFLVERMGDRNGTDTQLKAIRAVLGSVETLELARKGQAAHESYQDAGSAGAPARSRATKTVRDTLTSREKDHYEHMIKQGQYKDWKEVEAELAFSNPDIRRKAGARV